MFLNTRIRLAAAAAVANLTCRRRQDDENKRQEKNENTNKHLVCSLVCQGITSINLRRSAKQGENEENVNSNRIVL